MPCHLRQVRPATCLFLVFLRFMLRFLVYSVSTWRAALSTAPASRLHCLWVCLWVHVHICALSFSSHTFISFVGRPFSWCPRVHLCWGSAAACLCDFAAAWSNP